MGDTESIFDDDVELLKRPEVLEEDYQPEEFVCRDNVITDFKNVLKPIYKGRPPKNAFLYGDNGVGKTAVTRHLLNTLKTDLSEKNEKLSPEEQTGFTSVWINCKHLAKSTDSTSSYQVAVAIINSLRDRENQIKATGYAQQDVYSLLYNELNKYSGTVLIVLDEVDHMGQDDTLLYDLPRARDNAYVTDCRIALVGISNDYTFRRNLSPRVKDTLGENQIEFPPYDAPELQKILSRRAEKALHEDTYGEDTIRLCAALANKQADGSARRAIDLLNEAAEIAEEEGVPQIEAEKHVRRANENLQYDNIVGSLSDLNDQKLFILKALVHLDEADSLPARTTAVHDVYCEVSQEVGTSQTLTQRGMYNHLSKLIMFGFVAETTTNEGESGGRFKEHQFSEEVNPDMIQDAYEKAGHEWDHIDVTDIHI